MAGDGLPRPQPSQKVLFCTVTAPALLEAFCQQPGVSIAMPEEGGWVVFNQLLRTDAYLAAVAMANGWRLALPGAQA